MLSREFLVWDCSDAFMLISCSPGLIYTPIQVDTRDPKSMENLGASKSLGRPGQASEVATSFIFLASHDSSFYCMCCTLI